MTRFTESGIEDAALDYFRALGYVVRLAEKMVG